MFKQLSQLGKNLTDELAKGLTDELNGIGSEQLDKSGPYADLPSEVQIKLRKFEKYEQKYPLLLQAYKNEKLKTEKVEQIQRVLSESTPVSDISDVDSLKSYFGTVSQKTEMLNAEVKRLTVKNAELQSELEEAQKQLHERDLGSEKLQSDLNKIQKEMQSKDELIDSLKEKVADLNSAPQPVPAEEPVVPQQSASKKKNQKKKKKNSGPVVQAAKVETPANDQTSTLQDKLDVVQKERDDLKAENETLLAAKEELTEIRKVIKVKDEELESVRDMLRDVGNDLVNAQDQLKAVSSSSAEIKDLKLQLESLRSNNADNLKNYELKQNELNKELIALKKNEATVRQTLTQKEKIIDYLEKQVKEYSTKQGELNSQLDGHKKENSILSKKIESLNQEVEKWKNESKKNNGVLENYIKENGKLSERLEILQEKLETLHSLKSNSNDQVETIKKQCEELSFKLKDANKRIISLEDELNENANILQERNRETTTMRKMLNELQSDNSSRITALELKAKSAIEEKVKVENDLQMELTRKAQELKHLKQLNAELQSLNHEQKIKAEQYSAEIEELKSTFQRMKRSNSVNQEDSSELDTMVKSLREALAKSEKRQREVLSTNLELKEYNSELNRKFDRLSKNYKNLSLQISKNKEYEPVSSRSSPHTSRSSSIVQETVVSPASSGAQVEINDKIAYIKNVLLGFLEHREQRDQLLPVVKTLLQLDNNDEKRLLLSLK